MSWFGNDCSGLQGLRIRASGLEGPQCELLAGGVRRQKLHPPRFHMGVPKIKGAFLGIPRIRTVVY